MSGCRTSCVALVPAVLLLPLLAGAATEISVGGVAASTLDSLLESYVTAVLADDLAQAASCWRRVDRERAVALGVRYANAPLKVDSDSPLWNAREAIRRGACDWRLGRTGTAGAGLLAGTPWRELVLSQGADTLRFRYAFARDDAVAGAPWRLAAPVSLAFAQGIAGQSRFVDVADCRPGATAAGAEAMAALLDSCVADMCARLAVPDSLRGRLARAKLRYLVADPAGVEALAGAPTVGVANLQLDVVVTSHLCHAHELAHLLVNAWLREPPLYTLPLLQEGIAVHLGGRWGRHPRVLDRLGRTTLATGVVAFDDLLTRDDFLGQPADLTYAPAGAFAGYVLATGGPEGLRAAMLAVSGGAIAVAALDRPGVQRALSVAMGQTWPVLDAAFHDFVRADTTTGLSPGASVAGAAAELAVDDLRVTFSDGEGSPAVGIVVAAAGATPAAGAVLFGGAAESVPGQPGNPLFARQFPGRPYRGESHALIFSPEEVGLYDYRSQLLIALHAQGFWPSPDYADAPRRTLRFRLDRALLPAGRRVLVPAAAD